MKAGPSVTNIINFELERIDAPHLLSVSPDTMFGAPSGHRESLAPLSSAATSSWCLVFHIAMLSMLHGSTISFAESRASKLDFKSRTEVAATQAVARGCGPNWLASARIHDSAGYRAVYRRDSKEVEDLFYLFVDDDATKFNPRHLSALNAGPAGPPYNDDCGC